jgi:hypothetical protein
VVHRAATVIQRALIRVDEVFWSHRNDFRWFAKEPLEQLNKNNVADLSDAVPLEANAAFLPCVQKETHKSFRRLTSSNVRRALQLAGTLLLIATAARSHKVRDMVTSAFRDRVNVVDLQLGI